MAGIKCSIFPVRLMLGYGPPVHDIDLSNGKFLFKLKLLGIASILLILPGTNLLSQTADTGQVLILNTCDGTSFPYDRVTATFRAELQRQFAEPIAFNGGESQGSNGRLESAFAAQAKKDLGAYSERFRIEDRNNITCL